LAEEEGGEREPQFLGKENQVGWIEIDFREGGKRFQQTRGGDIHLWGQRTRKYALKKRGGNLTHYSRCKHKLAIKSKG